MSKAEKENRINSLAVTFLERQQIQPNIFADQIMKGYKEGYHQAEKDLADAFINKAVEWIDKNAFRYVVTRKYQGLDVTGLDTSLAADFKKALEDML